MYQRYESKTRLGSASSRYGAEYTEGSPRSSKPAGMKRYGACWNRLTFIAATSGLRGPASAARSYRNYSRHGFVPNVCRKAYGPSRLLSAVATVDGLVL